MQYRRDVSRSKLLIYMHCTTYRAKRRRQYRTIGIVSLIAITCRRDETPYVLCSGREGLAPPCSLLGRAQLHNYYRGYLPAT